MVKTTRQSPSNSTPGPSLPRRKREREDTASDTAQSKKTRSRVRYEQIMQCRPCTKFFSSVSRVANAIAESKRHVFILKIYKLLGAHVWGSVIDKCRAGMYVFLCSNPRTSPADVIIQCVARKVPELCKAYTPGKTDQDVGVRLSRLEHIIEMVLPQFFSSTTPSSSAAIGDHRRSRSVGLDDDMQSQHEEQDPSGGTFQSGKWYGNSASGSVAPASVLEQVCFELYTYSLLHSITIFSWQM